MVDVRRMDVKMNFFCSKKFNIMATVYEIACASDSFALKPTVMKI